MHFSAWASLLQPVHFWPEMSGSCKLHDFLPGPLLTQGSWPKRGFWSVDVSWPLAHKVDQYLTIDSLILGYCPETATVTKWDFTDLPTDLPIHCNRLGDPGGLWYYQSSTAWFLTDIPFLSSFWVSFTPIRELHGLSCIQFTLLGTYCFLLLSSIFSFLSWVSKDFPLFFKIKSILSFILLLYFSSSHRVRILLHLTWKVSCGFNHAMCYWS